jgi:hypothetical protein
VYAQTGLLSFPFLVVVVVVVVRTPTAHTHPLPNSRSLFWLAVEWGYISTNGPGIRVTLLAQPTTADLSTASPSPKDADGVVAYTFLCSDAERVAKILMPSSS